MTQPSQPTIPGPSTAGWLVLMGGGEFSFGETEEFDRFFIEKVPETNRRVAFLPTASGSTEYAVHLGEHFRKLDPSIELFNVPVYRDRDAKRVKNAERIREAGAVYLGGGVTNTLVSTIRGSVVEEAMREVLDRGGVVAGIGAGACAFGRWARSMVTVGAPIEGLGWIPDALVETGFRGVEDRRFAQLVKLERIRFAIGIPGDAALAVGPDRHGEILGSGNVAIVRKV